MGLNQGMPYKIPEVKQDFIFSAIAEELGGIFAVCLILVCVSCFLMFLNIAMQMKDFFYKLVALGLGTIYGFQIFLSIGGDIKFIPSTGVTLPLVSYGGSSLLSTLIIFAIIQGLYLLRERGEEEQETPKKAKKKPAAGAGQGRGRTPRKNLADAGGMDPETGWHHRANAVSAGEPPRPGVGSPRVIREPGPIVSPELREIELGLSRELQEIGFEDSQTIGEAPVRRSGSRPAGDAVPKSGSWKEQEGKKRLGRKGGISSHEKNIHGTKVQDFD